MRKFFILFTILLAISFPSLALAEKKIPILIYHSIAEYNNVGSKELFVTPANFEKQMGYLKEKGFTLLTFEQWNELGRVEKPIFITFDDGYKNNLNVYRIFQKISDSRFRPAATLFVISDFIGRQNRLSREELKRLGDSGYFSIQSHTATHTDLTKEKNFQHELKESKEVIQNITGKPVIALSYPYGTFNKKVVNETKKYYKFGLTTTPSAYIPKGAKDEKYYLPRLYVKYSTSLEDFGRLVEGVNR
ncbi:polysaccharide deacetylase family protein [Mesobacillus zeae]|uniref:Polysaccharide deacetylase family protein n=1 Tax=Mesobacillus zeae TaxID=1917180 RepID=A0A398B005_9BACI|nr:polysaccharide deacetylase family protein [Mesobacillus zeae]RID82238.1 polysaccharide deacetylase family protein [Mesobacillus zeae]